MKITRAQLKQIIKEEILLLERGIVLRDGSTAAPVGRSHSESGMQIAYKYYDPEGEEISAEEFEKRKQAESAPQAELDEIFGLGKKDKEGEHPRLKGSKKKLKKAEKTGKRMGKKQSGFDMRMQTLGLEEGK